jgi:hypothetical protein
MKLTRQQQVLAAVLAVGLGGLVVDRCLMSGSTDPSQAAAEFAVPAGGESAVHVPDARPHKAPAVEHVEESASMSLDDAALLPVRLVEVARKNQIDPDAQVLDGFAPPVVVETKPREPEKPAAAVLAEAFVKKHRLTAVMSAAGGGIAMIDGKAVRIGEACDQFVLTTVSARSAVLRLEGVDVELRLREPGLKGR